MKRIRSKRRTQIHSSDEGSWAISYGDMITLLLGFFIMFFSLNPKKAKNEKLNQAILSSLAAIDPIEKNMADDIGQLKQKELKAEEDMVVQQIGERIIIKFPNISFFKSGSTTITPSGRASIVKFSKKYMPYVGSTVVQVVGFTDDEPIIKSKHLFKDNLELSALRAVSAQRTMMISGIPLDRTRIGGHGISEYVKKIGEDVSQDFAKQRAIARTIVFVIEPEQEL